MKEGKPSLTAELAAAVRAVESMKLENERICYDPLARKLLGPVLGPLARNRLLARAILWAAERIAPGVPDEVIARTRYIDDRLEACVAEGVSQLVILGAGYDSRPYRFDEIIRRIKVFELDHPATQELKIKRLKRIYGFLPAHVNFVPVDFDLEPMESRLLNSGYDPEARTLFIWEGVTYYLTARAVDETLAFIANYSAKGSSVIFDYAFQSVLDGASELKQLSLVLKAYQAVGAPLTSEHFVFGLERGTVKAFLAARGFEVLESIENDLSGKDCFQHPTRKDMVCRLCGVVHARVR